MALGFMRCRSGRLGFRWSDGFLKPIYIDWVSNCSGRFHQNSAPETTSFFLSLQTELTKLMKPKYFRSIIYTSRLSVELCRFRRKSAPDTKSFFRSPLPAFAKLKMKPRLSKHQTASATLHLPPAAALAPSTCPHYATSLQRWGPSPSGRLQGRTPLCRSISCPYRCGSCWWSRRI